jgi:hypothetical protein
MDANGKSKKPHSRGKLCYELAKADFRRLDGDRERVSHLRQLGFSFGAISNALKIPKTSVYRWCQGEPTREHVGRPALLSTDQVEQLRVEAVKAAEGRSPMKINDIRQRVSSPTQKLLAVDGRHVMTPCFKSDRYLISIFGESGDGYREATGTPIQEMGNRFHREFPRFGHSEREEAGTEPCGGVYAIKHERLLLKSQSRGGHEQVRHKIENLEQS